MNFRSVILFLGLLLGSNSLFAGMVPDTIRMADFDQYFWVSLDSANTIYFTNESTTAIELLNSNEPILTGNYSGYHKEQWFYVFVENDTPFDDMFFMHLNNSFEKGELHVIEEGKVTEIFKGGSYTPYSERQIPTASQHLYVELAPGESKLLLFKIYNYTNRKGDLEYIYFGNSTIKHSTVEMVFKKNVRSQGFHLGFQGAVIMMILFMMFLYVQNRSTTAFVYYAFYLSTISFYFMMKIAHNGPYYLLFPESPFLRETLNGPAQLLMAIGYNLFILRFLRIKEKAKNIYNFVSFANILFAVLAVAEFSYLYVTRDLLMIKSSFVLVNVFLLVLGVLIFFWIFKTVKSQLVKYMVWGGGFFLGGSVLAFIYTIHKFIYPLPFLPEIGISPVFISQLSILIEILFFSLGIGKLIQLSSQEKEKTNDAYITQLVENEELSKTHSAELETRVEERSAEVVAKNKELDEAKNTHQKLQSDLALLDREIRLLRLQLNPDFIFNSLNSIRYFILKQNEDKAIEYIESFSKLLRMILDYSKRDFISINDELVALQLYIKFENERLNQKIDFTLTVDKSLDVNVLAIQPLLLQPFVENSILHGLMHKREKGCLEIDIRKTSATEITIRIEDDGIGREQSEKLNASKTGKYKSQGIEITQNRIEMTNSSINENYGFKIEDLLAEDGNPSGTRVVFTIEVQQYEPLG